MLKALLPLLLLTSATAQSITGYDICSGFVTNAALPAIAYQDSTSSQELCWAMCNANAGCSSLAWGASTSGLTRCNLFTSDIDPTTFIPNPFKNLYIVVAYKRTDSNTPTANLPSSGCSAASLPSVTGIIASNSTTNATIDSNNSTLFGNLTIYGNSTAPDNSTLSGNLTALPTATGLNATLLNATSTATVNATRSGLVPVPTDAINFNVTANASVSSNATSGRSGIVPTASAVSSLTSLNATATASPSTNASTSSTQSSSSVMPSSSTVSTQTKGTGTCIQYTITYPATADCCPGISLGLDAAPASRLRRRQSDNSSADANIVILSSDQISSISSEAAASTAGSSFITSALMGADTPKVSLTPPSFPDPSNPLSESFPPAPSSSSESPSSSSSSSSSTPSSSSAPVSSSTSSSAAAASSSAATTCQQTTVVRTCTPASQDSETKDFLDGYRGLSGQPLTIDCGSAGTFTY